jgi:hypothetical protein
LCVATDHTSNGSAPSALEIRGDGVTLVSIVTKSGLIAFLAAAAIGSALVGAQAAGTVGDAPVTGCVKRGTVSVVKAGHRCAKGSKKLTWNIPGPAGLAGSKGPTGPRGAAGSPGLVNVKLENAAGLSCHKSDGGALGTITVQHDAATGLEEFVCH